VSNPKNRKQQEVMSNEQQLLIDEAYENYCKSFENQTLIEEYSFDTDPMTQFMFINKCKNDQEFSEKWGLKIEERELSELERMNIGKSKGMWKEFQFGNVHEPCNERGISTKLITIKYNDKTIESYEN
jgi:hypothetical protein